MKALVYCIYFWSKEYLQNSDLFATNPVTVFTAFTFFPLISFLKKNVPLKLQNFNFWFALLWKVVPFDWSAILLNNINFLCSVTLIFKIDWVFFKYRWQLCDAVSKLLSAWGYGSSFCVSSSMSKINYITDWHTEDQFNNPVNSCDYIIFNPVKLKSCSSLEKVSEFSLLCLCSSDHLPFVGQACNCHFTMICRP